MSKEDQKSIYRKSWLPLLLVLLAIILIIWVLRPMLNTFKSSALNTAIKKQQLKDLNGRIEDLNALKGEFRQASRDIEIVSQALPSGPNIPEVISMLEGIAAKSGVSLANMQPEETQGGAEVIFQVTFSGSFEQMNNFFSNLEKNIRPLNIKTLTVSGSAQDNSSSLSATAKIAAPYVASFVTTLPQSNGETTPSVKETTP